ncbi:MAG: hypothetical protein ACLGIV_13720 [Actinomycetes bacterium]
MITRSIVVAVLAPAALGIVLAPPAAAAPAPQPAFGQHVSECARTTGLDGDHNPGMHRGITGWHAHSC